ncbi:MAG TPA: DUF58 domain-containing protein [Pirellulaceae bacterium]|nr:DUF58 domain-containing protein [Pirellulaceae bacterium]
MNVLLDFLQSDSDWQILLAWLWLGLLTAPFIPLAAWKRIHPHTPLLLATIVPCALSVMLAVFPTFVLPVLIIDLVIGIAAIVDLLTLPRRKHLSPQREMLRIASLRAPHRVTVQLNNLSQRAFQIWLRDDVPQEFTAQPHEFAVKLAPRSRSTVHYELRASRRGAFKLKQIHLRARSWLGLWQRFLSYPVEGDIHVYPDMKQLSEYALLARTNRLSLMGVRRTRRVGQDHDFERLRDYTLDDNYKHLDWRATARRNKLTVKDFQTSQSQRIIFLVDCGRMMTNEAAGLSLLDHAFNSALMLSYVALRQGDSVGMITFSDRIHSYIPPRGGDKQMNHLLHASYDRFPTLVESRYDEAFLYLSSHCRKRALVVLITNVIDEVNAQQVHAYLSTQVGKHLPLGVLLRDRQLFTAADQPSPTGPDLYRAAAAAHILAWRHQVIMDLQHQGVLCLDSFPEELTAPLVNKYLELKARHML